AQAPPSDCPRLAAGREAEYCDVEFAAGDSRFELVASGDPQDDLNMRMRLPEGAQCRGNVDGGDGRDDPDAQTAPNQSGCGRRVLGGSFGGFQAGAGGGQERLTGGGELDAATGTGEERDPEFVLQSFDLMAERGLHDVAAGGGSSEAGFLRESDHVPQLLELHSSILVIDALKRMCWTHRSGARTMKS